jgi:hypothetical protein
MPWVNNKQAYLETDIRLMGDEFYLLFHLKNVVKRYEEVYQPDMPPISPPLEAGLQLIAEYEKVRFAKTHFGQGGADGKRKLELIKQLQPMILQWGEYMAHLVDTGKVYFFMTGFPSINMGSLRRPTSVSSFRVERKWPNTTCKMSCRKEPAILLFFHWQASEDGGKTWIDLATTKLPHYSTKKLDPQKKYIYRMYMSNPKGNSDFHVANHNWPY